MPKEKEQKYLDPTIEEWKWSYQGPVLCFGKVINPKYNARTIATTKKKAIANLKDQYRRWYGLTKTYKLEIDEKRVVCEGPY